MNKKNITVHNISIRLILVELRVIWDLFFEFYIIRAKIYNGLITLDYYKSAMRVYCLYVSYIFISFIILYMVVIYIIYSKLRLFLYLIVVVISPMWMNTVIMSALIVEQLINIFGE